SRPCRDGKWNCRTSGSGRSSWRSTPGPAISPGPGSKDRPDHGRHNPHHPAYLLHRGAERRHEDDDVPERPDEQAKPSGLRSDARADALGQRVGRLRLTVPHELDPDDKAELADVADVRMLCERSQQAAERGDLRPEL